MKHLSRREFLKGAAVAGAGVALAACAQPTATPVPPTKAPAAAAAPTAAPAPTKAPEPTKVPPTPVPVKLVYWAEPRFQLVPGKEDQTKELGDYERLLAKEFTGKTAGVTITAEHVAWEELVTKVAAAIAAGTPPDLLKDYLGRTSAYANQDLLEPLQKAIPEAEYKDFLPSLVQLYTIKGNFHGLPIYFWVTCFGGNKLAFQNAKADDKLPNADGTYPIDRFEAGLKALAVKDKHWPLAMQVSSEQGDYANFGFFWANGAKFYKDGDYSKTAFNSPETLEILTKLVDWYKAGYIIPGVTTVTGTEMNNIMLKGQASLGITGPGWMSNTYVPGMRQGLVTQQWDPFFSIFPGKTGQKSGGLATGPTSVVIFKQKDDAKRKMAVDFARFLVGPDKQKEYCVVSGQYPTRTSTGNPFEKDPVLTNILKWAQTYGVEDMGLGSPAYAQVRVKLPPELQAAFLGKKSPKDALADYEKAANEILAKYKS